MTRYVDPDLQALLNAGTTAKLARFIHLTRADGTVFRFTTHDRDLDFMEDVVNAFDVPTGVFQQATYRGGSLSLEAIQHKADMSIGNSNVQGLITDEVLNDTDLRAGAWNYAKIRIYGGRWDVQPSPMGVRLGWGVLGEVVVNDNGQFQVEYRSLMDRMNYRVGQVYQPGCRASFGDKRCGLDASAFSVIGSVGSVTNRGQFSLGVSGGQWPGGTVTFTTGPNAGITRVILVAASEALFFAPFPFKVSAGDTFLAVQGCDKKFSTCRDIYNNAVNFRGEPLLPGKDQVMNYPWAWVGGA